LFELLISDRKMVKLLVLAALCASSHAARLHERPSVRMQRTQPPASPGAKPTLLRLRGGGVAPASPAATNLASKIAEQLAYEVAHCTVSKAKFFGFCGACCNWFLGLSAVNDALNNGPEIISLQMTLTMLAYSLLFSRWAGWDVSPANFMLAGSHMFNIAAQLNQLRRVVEYKLDNGGKAEISALATKSVGAQAQGDVARGLLPGFCGWALHDPPVAARDQALPLCRLAHRPAPPHRQDLAHPVRGAHPHR
jgi:hypothetical protein